MRCLGSSVEDSARSGEAQKEGEGDDSGVGEFKDWAVVWSGEDTSCKIGKLMPGCLYEVAVRSSNAVGVSLWSPAVQLATAASVPGMPGSPRGKETDSGQFVEWTSALSHGAAVSSYTLQGDDGRGGGMINLYCGPSQSWPISEKLGGSDLRFRVRARNEEGDGPWSRVVPLAFTKRGMCGVSSGSR